MTRSIVTAILLVLLIAGTIVANRLPGNSLHSPESDIIFAHNNHTDIECAECHTSVESSELSTDVNFPAMDVCADCHDIDAEDECELCHRDSEDPQTSPHGERTILFSHKNHIERGVQCTGCHGQIAVSTNLTAEYMPDMRSCFACHDNKKAGDRCSVCHADNVTLLDIHPTNWRHEHEHQALQQKDWCMQCHQQDFSCLACHRGDNLLGKIHDLNYLYTHGLDAKSKLLDCSACHDNQSFCYACHERENRIPLLHSSAVWFTDHGRAARRDPENCASCHDSADPTCARSGCHRDADGIRGTDPRFHSAGTLRFRSKGPWHSDEGYFCFTCHTNTRQAPIGFCGYCH